MARRTKLRATQTRAGDEYSADDLNLATDGEVEERILKHSGMFHHNRNEKTRFTYLASGGVETVEIFKPDGITLLQKTDFTYTTEGNLLSVTKEVWDDIGNQYIKNRKDFTFDTLGNLTDIQNTIL